MIVYLDTSVILRMILREPNELREWAHIRHVVTSELTRVECHRGLYRALLAGRLDDDSFERARGYARQILNRLTVVNISEDLLERAEGPVPGSLGALDAIHLVSALAFRDRLADGESPLLFGTHDRALSIAAGSASFEVVGVA